METPTPLASPTELAPSDRTDPTAGIVIGALSAGAAIFSFIYCLCRRRKGPQTATPALPAAATAASPRVFEMTASRADDSSMGRTPDPALDVGTPHSAGSNPHSYAPTPAP